MTLVSDIIRDAYRESNINAIGISPTAAQTDEALRLLNRIVAGAVDDAAEHLIPYPIGTNNITEPYGYAVGTPYPDIYIPTARRMMLNLTAPATVYLDPDPHDGARFGYYDVSGNTATFPLTISGNGRMIAGNTNLVVSVNGSNAEYFYRDDLATWVVVAPIGISDIFPFPTEFDDMFVIMLAMRLNPRNGAALDPQSQATLKMATQNFSSQYAQTEEVHSELGLLRLTNRRHLRDIDGYGATQRFNKGYGIY